MTLLIPIVYTPPLSLAANPSIPFHNDKRGLVLDDLPDDRDRILEEFLTELEKVGPPPPPTATKPLAKR